MATAAATATPTTIASSTSGVSNGNIVVCKGADQSVISKLRNNLEQKEIEKQKVLKNTASAVDDDQNKSADIASIIAARIRTKGELKGFTPLPPVPAPPPSSQPPAQAPPSQPSQSKPSEVESSAKAKIIDVVKSAEILCKVEIEPTTSVFDLMDWGSTCNDFLKQLQNGGGSSITKKRNATKGPRRVKVDDGHETSTSSKETPIAPPPKPSSTSKTNDSSSDDEDDNKPLHLLRQQSLSENSKSQNDSEPKMKTPNKGSPPSKASKIAKEKQRDKREREKRLQSLGSSSSDSSDSEHEAAGDKRPAKTSGSSTTPKRKPKSLALQRSPRASLSNRDDEHSDDVAAPGKKDKMKAAQKKRNRSQSSSDSDVVVQKPAKKTKSKQLLDDSSSSSSSSSADNDHDDDERGNTSGVNNDPHHDAEETIPAHIVKKKKSLPVANKVEETMTRSKRKRELETQIANSKVLRNDKMIKCVAPPSGDTKSTTTTTTTPTKRQSKATSESSTTKGQQPQQQMSASESSKSRTKKRTSAAADSENDDSKSANPKRKSTRSLKIQTSSSESEESALSEAEPENVTERLRSRKSKTTAVAPATNSDEKANEAKKEPEKPLTRRSSKCTPTKKAVALAAATATAPEIDVSEESRFQPGWEEEVYEFKRSLKIPASLITVGRPSWHRKSTSLPDLDPQHSSDASESFGSEINKKIRAKVTEATPLSSTPLKKRPCGGSASKKVAAPIAEQATTGDIDSNPKSIIDVLHQRVFRPVARKKMRYHSNQNEPKILPQTNEAELLPTPGSKGNVFKSDNVFETAVLKSRTRKEYRAMKNQEIIREVFGGEDRPASAPPAHFDVAAATVQVKQEPEPETQQLTFDQQYDQYLEQMNIDYGEKIRKLKSSTSATVTSTTATSTAAKPLLIPKLEKMDGDSLLNPDDDETQDTELNACFDVNKDALGERVDTPSVLSEVDGATPTSFKGVLKSGKKARSNRHSRRKGSSGKFASTSIPAVHMRLI